jgi:HAD superfamily hydrolase (TIGR01509 family)
MFNAVIFDWDGTLVDSHQIVVSSFQKALATSNHKMSKEFIRRLIGVGAAETFREILRVSKTCFDETQIENLVKKKVQNEIEMSNKIKPLKGAMELLSTLQGKVRVGLASMNNWEIINHIIKLKNMERFFNAIITADEIANSKPSPEIFLKCAKRLNCKPSECVVFEDSIFGVEAAKRAKMAVIAIPTGAYSKEELRKVKPELVVDSLQEKRKIFNFIFQ